MSYSLDDVLPPRKAQYIDGGVVGWIAAGHATWVVVLAWMGFAQGAPVVLVGAIAQLAGLALVAVAWTRTRRSINLARSVAWVSTILLGLAAALVTYLLVVTVWAVFADYGETGPELLALLLPVLLVLVVVVSVPTIGGFVAAIGLARDLRHTSRAGTARVEDWIPN